MYITARNVKRLSLVGLILISLCSFSKLVRAETILQSTVCQANTVPIITTPTDRSTLDSEAVTIQGHATAGAEITFIVNGLGASQTTVDSHGQFFGSTHLKTSSNTIVASAKLCDSTLNSATTTVFYHGASILTQNFITFVVSELALAGAIYVLTRYLKHNPSKKKSKKR